MIRAALVAILGLLAACGDDVVNDGYCLPQGRVSIGAAGFAGDPLPNFADCFERGTPVVSLDEARGATVTENSVAFDDAGLSASVDEATCRVAITYTFDSMLSDGTPTDGTSIFAADPDTAAGRSLTTNPEGSIEFEWQDQNDNTVVCGNQITDVVIEVDPE